MPGNRHSYRDLKLHFEDRFEGMGLEITGALDSILDSVSGLELIES